MLPDAYTHYSDHSGTAAADWHDPSKFSELAEALGIDVKLYFPIGLDIDFSEMTLEPQVSAIYAVDVDEIGGKGIDAIRAHAEANGGNLKVTKFEVNASRDVLARYMKRLEIVLENKNLRPYMAEIRDAR
jgi:hypothetical protein